jgi:hypothetical protein
VDGLPAGAAPRGTNGPLPLRFSPDPRDLHTSYGSKVFVEVRTE